MNPTNEKILKERLSKGRQSGVIRFLKYANPSNGCWIWSGGIFRDGYGRICVNRKLFRAHRLSYQIFIGELSSVKELVCHSCDNPICVNPFHLFKGTHYTNAMDMVAKNRNRGGVGEKHGMAILKEAQVREIRSTNLSIAALARLYKISESTISRIVKNQTWKKVK